MIKLLYGNEPFLIDCNKNKATDKVIYKDLNLAFFNSFNQEVLRLALTHPFMEDQRVIVLNIDNLKELDNKKRGNILVCTLLIRYKGIKIKRVDNLCRVI